MDKYAELRHFRLEGNSILQSYNMNNTEKIVIIKNWLVWQGIHIIETIMQADQELCNTVDGLFENLNKKFHWQYYEIIKSLQCCKLSRQNGESAEECMGRLRIAAAECQI